MTAPTNKESADREFCPAMSADGTRCDFATHPGAVHWTWRNGYPHPWQALPERDEVWRNQGATEDPLRDAPEIFRLVQQVVEARAQHYGVDTDPGMPKAIIVVEDEFPPLLEKGREMTQHVEDLLRQGRATADWRRPLVEATSLDGRFVYGLLEASPTGFGVPVVHETMPESGGVPSRVAISWASVREVFVPGHRGNCHGDCCREGYSEDTSYPECWDYDTQIATGIAERCRPWKDWVL